MRMEDIEKRYTEIEFVCANPAYKDASDPTKQQRLMQDLKTVPGVLPYMQDWGEGQVSLAVIILDKKNKKYLANLVRRLAKKNNVRIDLVREVPKDFVDSVINKTLEFLI